MVRLNGDTGYLAQDFWKIVFALKGSAIPAVFQRSLPLFGIDVGVAIMEHYGQLERANLRIPGSLLSSFALLVSLLFSFRITQAFNKWERGCKATNDMTACVSDATSRLCAMMPRTPKGLEVTPTIELAQIAAHAMLRSLS